MAVINGVYLKDFTALPGAVADANIIPIAITGDPIAYRTTVAGIVTDARVTSKLLTGLSITGSAVLATDTILQAFGKVQNQLNNRVSSVGLSMPSAFTVASSPITSSGTIAVTGAGLASQYIRGDGQLADFPTGGGGGGASVSYYFNGSVNQGTLGGNVYKEMNKVPVLGAGTDFTISADGYIAQFLTDAGDPGALLIPAGNWNFETYFSASSGGGSPSFYVELYKYDGATFTLIASNSAIPELISFGTTITAYFSALAVPETILLATDRLAIRVYVNHSSKTITLHTEGVHLCEVQTTFTTGLQALNGLTKQTQYFAVGTSGTDFAISSATDTHTFNLPTASATNRGALSSADWSTFNSKQGTITLTTTGTSGAATLIGNTLNIPNYADGGVTTLAVIGSSPNQFGATIALNQFNLEPASDSFGGVVTTGTQTFAGNKTLTGTLGGTSATFSGTVTAANVNVTSSSIPANGMYLSVANTLNFATNSGNRMTIGTTGSITMTSTLSLGNFLTLTTANTFIYGGTTLGSIQYGNSTSSTHLKTYGATHATLANVIQLTNNSVVSLTLAASGAATFASSATATAFIPSAATIPTNGMYLSGTNTLDFATNSTNRLSIASTGAATFSGNIGVGGGTPSIFSPYSVASFGSLSTTNNGITIASSSAGGGYIEFADGTTGNQAYRGYMYYNHVTDALGFATAGTDRVSITSTGVLTGTSASFVDSVAGYNTLLVRNTSAATNAAASIDLGNDLQAFRGELVMNSSTYTPSGIYQPDGLLLYSGGVGGTTIASNNASGNIRMYAGGSLALTIASTGAATFSSSVTDNGTIHAYANKTANYTLTGNDYYIKVTADATITLPTAVGRAGQRYVIKAIGAGVDVTMSSTSSQTINGGSAGGFTLNGSNENAIILFSDGANWLTEVYISGA
jgi:hypothetical protein